MLALVVMHPTSFPGHQSHNQDQRAAEIHEQVLSLPGRRCRVPEELLTSNSWKPGEHIRKWVLKERNRL